MIFNSLDEIKQQILRPLNHDLILRGRQISKHHKLHLTGQGLDQWLDKIQGVENEHAVSIRRALKAAITVPVMMTAIKPIDKVFNARGGSEVYDFSNISYEKEFKEKYHFKKITENFWNKHINIDPFGLTFIELDENGNEPYHTYKSSSDIYDIDYSEWDKIEYVIFEPYTKQTERNAKFWRVVDDAKDYLIKQVGNNFSIVEDDTYDNYFGEVPAMFFSNRHDRRSDAFDSWVSEALYLADEYLLDYTIYKIYKLKQGIPYVYEIERNCPKCKGSGISDDGETCSLCGGDGIAKNRDVSDIIIVPVDNAQDYMPPAGYVQPDSVTRDQMEQTLSDLENRIFSTVWGVPSHSETTGTNTTAFEVSVRKESEYDKLNKISTNAEQWQTKLTELYARYFYETSFLSVYVKFGRNYLTQGADQLFQQYLKAKQDSANASVLNELITRYYYSSFEYNETQLNRALNVLKTKPLFHLSESEVSGMANILPQEELYKNLYFDKYVYYVEYEKGINFGLLTIDEINDGLNKYIQKIKLDNQNI